MFFGFGLFSLKPIVYIYIFCYIVAEIFMKWVDPIDNFYQFQDF